MGFRAGVLALLLVSKGWGAVRHVDLSWQFSEEPGAAGCCRGFSSAPLLEAAVYRAHARHETYSSADLFLRQLSLYGGVYASKCADGKCFIGEGGWAEHDASWAADNGLLSPASYADYARRCGERHPFDDLSSAASAWIDAWSKRPEEIGRDLLEAPKLQAELARALPACEDDAAGKERARAKALMKGFKVTSRAFRVSTEDSPERCRAAAKERLALVLQEFDQGRPVAVGLWGGSAKGWNAADSGRDESRNLVLTGYDENGERLVFHGRNAWPGEPSELDAGALCRVDRLTTVTIPGEKPTFKPR